MKINKKKRASIIILFLVFAAGSGLAQTNEQMVTMVKYMIQQFKELTAENLDSDEVLQDGFPYNPELDLGNKNLYETGMSNVSSFFSLSEYENGYALWDDKELPTNGINLDLSFLSLPGFSNLNAWYELSSLEDSKGKEIRLDEKEIERYRDLGIIDDGYNYPMPGQYFERLWLKRELEYGETLNFQGTIFIEYPSDIESITFYKVDQGVKKSFQEIQMTLLEMDRNMVTLLLKGNRNTIEGLQMNIFNAEGKLFTSTSSNGIDAQWFDMDNLVLRDLSDDEITASVEDFDMSNMEIQQVKKIKVFGNINTLNFVKINEVGLLEVPFKVELSF